MARVLSLCTFSTITRIYTLRCMLILANLGLVQGITYNNVTRFIMSEELAGDLAG